MSETVSVIHQNAGNLPVAFRPMEPLDFVSAAALALALAVALGIVASKGADWIRAILFVATLAGFSSAMFMANGYDVLWFMPLKAQQLSMIALSWMPLTWIISDIIRKRASRVHFLRKPTDVDRERTKLTAQAFDRASTTCFAVGVAGPAAAFLWGTPAATMAVDILGAARMFALWAGVAISLHLLARRILKGLS